MLLKNPESDRKETVGYLNDTTYIDKITMECMMNKKHYKTYLEKTNPTRLRESRNLQNKIISNSIYIENIFEQLLETSKKKIKGQNGRYNNKIQRAFYDFIEHSLQYIENERENEDELVTEDSSIDQRCKKQIMLEYGEDMEEHSHDTIQNKFMYGASNGDESVYDSIPANDICESTRDNMHITITSKEKNVRKIESFPSNNYL